jgi:WD40 repeat protein
MAVNGTLRRWDMPAVARFTEHMNWVLDVDLSRDGRWLATAGSDGYGHIMSTTDITRYVGWIGDGRGFALEAVRIDPSDPHRVFTLGRWASAPEMWHWAETTLPPPDPLRFDQPQQPGATLLASIGVSPDGTTLIAGDWDGNIHVWDARTGHLLPDRGLPGRGYPAMDVTFDPTGRLIATTAREGVRLIDIVTGSERVLDHPNATRVDFDSSGSRLVSVADGGTVLVWTTTGTLVKELVGHTSRLGHASFSPDGALVAVGSATGLVEVWDVATGATLALTRHHGDSVNDIVFVPGDRHRLVTASDDRTVVAWDCTACDDPDAVIEAAEVSLGMR